VIVVGVTATKLERLRSGKLSAVEHVESFLKKIKKENKKFNVFLYVAEIEALTQAKEVDKKLKKKKAGKLAGLCIAVKANINVLGMPASCASKTLEKYVSTFDADVIKRIKSEDGIIIGIVNCDEFACGISGETSAFGPTKNPVAPAVVPGGSSSGSAAAVAAGFCDLALGSDTGGSIRNPASHCGVVGVKPSYGRVSRYGLIDLSMSLDVVGVFAPDAYSAALLLEVIAGPSDADATTFPEMVPDYSLLKKINKKITIGVSKEFEKLCVNKKMYALVIKTAKQVSERLGDLKNISLKYTHLGVETYYPIVYTEFFSATRRFDGRRYGERIDSVAGEEVLRRLLGGKEISKAEHDGQYYRKALATKQLIKDDFDNVFKKVDVLIAPVTPDLPHKLGSKLKPQEAYAIDAFTIPASLAGVAAGVVSVGEIDGVPVGVQVIVPAFKEELMFGVMYAVEESRQLL
jgi:aspartyl-tRNA(Asn)/glutamyl-tRNA(Gln) amidotransferase subunit A